MGELVLRRRTEPRLGSQDVYEVKLGEEFLMSSLFFEGEVALAELGLAPLGSRPASVVVGGLGLGYTARTALDNPATRDLFIIETMPEVIAWHQQGLVPLGKQISADPRTSFVCHDFFKLVAGDSPGFDASQPQRQFDAVLLDIDHSPAHVLHPDHHHFYSVNGLQALRARLRPGGVFALWSNDPPEKSFEELLGEVFADVAVHIVDFNNPYSGGKSSNTVFVSVV